VRRPPVWLFAVLCLLVAATGWTVAQSIGNSPYATVTDTVKTRLPGETRIRTIKRVTRGRVVTLPGGVRVVHVPLLIVHVDHKVIRIPPHNLPFHRAGPTTHGVTAAVAQPLVPVTVTAYVPTTVFVPTTSTVTTTDTTWVPTTVTTTLPLDTSGPDT